MRRWRSGQSQETVNLSPYGLRRFESFSTHQIKNTRITGVFYLYVLFEKDSKAGARRREAGLRDFSSLKNTCDRIRSVGTACVKATYFDLSK